MITDLNRFLIVLGSLITKATKDIEDDKNCQFHNEEYLLGYHHALLNVQGLAQDIHNGRNGY